LFLVITCTHTTPVPDEAKPLQKEVETRPKPLANNLHNTFIIRQKQFICQPRSPLVLSTTNHCPKPSSILIKFHRRLPEGGVTREIANHFPISTSEASTVTQHNKSLKLFKPFRPQGPNQFNKIERGVWEKTGTEGDPGHPPEPYSTVK